MKVLMLGGTGAMGVALAPMLKENGAEVFITSRQKRTGEDKIHYIKGNAHDKNFLETLLSQNSFDCIIDFMAYNTNEFLDCYELLCKSAEQYIFLSSSRVYANEKILTEKTVRLLDTIKDKKYLATDDYAIAKARQEDLLRQSVYQNWTIVRPYISYNDERLQLGCFEKEEWLYRAIQGKTVVFFKDVENSITTLTYAADVAHGILKLVGKPEAMCEAYHIVTEEYATWGDILDIYKRVFKKITGKDLKVLELEDCYKYASTIRYHWPYQYDRLYNRIFDHSKFIRMCGEPFEFKKLEQGLTACLTNFIREEKGWLDINWSLEGYKDKATHERTSLKEIPDMKNKIKYLVVRYTPYLRWRTGI